MGMTTVPTLSKAVASHDGPLSTNTAKSSALFASFFPAQDTSSIHFPFQPYPNAAFIFCNVTERQILRAIQHLSPFKASGPDGIPNAILKHCVTVNTPYLTPIFRASIQISYYLDQWHTYRTIVLHKPCKPDYTKAKAYQGIALLNMISKVLSTCVAKTLVYHLETLNLLPAGCQDYSPRSKFIHYLCTQGSSNSGTVGPRRE